MIRALFISTIFVVVTAAAIITALISRAVFFNITIVVSLSSER
jgi:hypothetical protein